MTEVIGVRFRGTSKIYYFGPKDKKVEAGQLVVVETAKGVECAEVTMENKKVDDNKIIQPLKDIIRVATDEDKKKLADNERKEKRAFDICIKKIEKHKLDMKLTRVEYSFDNSKIIFFFTADGRVDFRDLVKDLAAEFKSRIELRQIGVRDEAKMLGGIGICGQQFCCSRFLDEFQPVSIKMAKEQNLSPNPLKISGSCGRLMCCLKYEHDTYEKLLREVPCQGSVVKTKEGKGVVVETSLLTGKVKVKLDSKADPVPEVFNSKEVKVITKGTHQNHKKRIKDIIEEYDSQSN